MNLLARLEDDFAGGVPVVRVHGEIDASNARDIADRLRAGLTNRSNALVVDLSPTTYLDSAGINLLVALGEEMARRQQRLALVVDPGSPIARMVSITGLDRVLAVRATLPEAVQGVREDDDAAGTAVGPVIGPG